MRGDIPDFGGAGQEFSLQHANRLIDLIDQNPMAAVPKTPWSEMAFAPPLESAMTMPPLEVAQTTTTETVNYHTDVRFPGQVRTFDQSTAAAGAADAGEVRELRRWTWAWPSSLSPLSRSRC
ncbi:MAG: hypothetical protein V9H69_24590 [Anaerolineae bacterium]